jgi:hypothetical protein
MLHNHRIDTAIPRLPMITHDPRTGKNRKPATSSMDGVEYQYHVQVEADGLERRVWESQLRPNTRRPEVVDGDAAVAGGAQSSGGPANRIGAHADDADPS